MVSVVNPYAKKRPRPDAQVEPPRQLPITVNGHQALQHASIRSDYGGGVRRNGNNKSISSGQPSALPNQQMQTEEEQKVESLKSAQGVQTYVPSTHIQDDISRKRIAPLYNVYRPTQYAGNAYQPQNQGPPLSPTKSPIVPPKSFTNRLHNRHTPKLKQAMTITSVAAPKYQYNRAVSAAAATAAATGHVHKTRQPNPQMLSANSKGSTLNNNIVASNLSVTPVQTSVSARPQPIKPPTINPYAKRAYVVRNPTATTPKIMIPTAMTTAAKVPNNVTMHERSAETCTVPNQATPKQKSPLVAHRVNIVGIPVVWGNTAIQERQQTNPKSRPHIKPPPKVSQSSQTITNPYATKKSNPGIRATPNTQQPLLTQRPSIRMQANAAVTTASNQSARGLGQSQTITKPQSSLESPKTTIVNQFKSPNQLSSPLSHMQNSSNSNIDATTTSTSPHRFVPTTPTTSPIQRARPSSANSAERRSSVVTVAARPASSSSASTRPFSVSTTNSMPSRFGKKLSSAKKPNLSAFRPAEWTNPVQSQPAISSPPPPIRIPGLELPGEPALPRELQFSSDRITPTQDEYRQQLVKNANISAPLLNGWKLFSHQKKSVLKALVMRRMILALDMGLGKTLIGCVWAKAFKLAYGNLKIFVVCPVSLKTDWQRTAEAATGLDMDDGSGETSLDLKISSWAKVPKKVHGSVDQYVVVCDEAHSMQSMTSARTKDMLTLVKAQKCVGVLLLTGTPMKNGKPCNLFPLLKAVRHPFGDHQKAFEKHFCAGVDKNFGRGPAWDASGASNLKQLKRLTEPNLLHMTKEQCLAEIPSLTRETKRISVSARFETQYTDAVKELAKVYEASLNMKDAGEAILGSTQKLRFVCSLAKISATVEIAKRILQEKPAVVIFTNFVKIAKSVCEQLEAGGWSVELLTGKTPPKKRPQMVDNFQEGLSSVFVATFGAGGVGLTLTASSTVILLDRPWTPGETRQAEDRVRRIGQTKPVQSIWISAFHMDEQIDRVLESKKQTSNAVLADGESDGSCAKISIQQLVKKLLASPMLTSKSLPEVTTTR